MVCVEGIHRDKATEVRQVSEILPATEVPVPLVSQLQGAVWGGCGIPEELRPPRFRGPAV